MSELARLFCSTLPGTAAALEQLRGRLGADAAVTDAVRRLAHSLRGSGGTYGFAAISAAAAAVEDASAAELDAGVQSLLAELHAARADAGGPDDVPAYETAHALRILLVDDDAGTRLLAGLLLRRAGHDVREAADAAEAVAACRAHPPELLLVDVLLGEDDGVELASTLRRMVPDAALIFLTGATAEPQLARMRTLQPAAIVHKPFDPATLPLLIDQRLHGTR